MRMFYRFSALFLLLFSVTLLSQNADQAGHSDPRIPKIFRDPALDITYSYPGLFIPVRITPADSEPAAAEKAAAQCVHATLSAGSQVGSRNSVFVLSRIDNTCPGVLNAAQHLGAFTREQIVRQLKQYGTPEITKEPTRYTIDGHPAAVTIALAQVEDRGATAQSPVATYAAKACVLGSVPEKSGKSGTSSGVSHVLCFDFTTPQRELLTQMLGFTIQFGEHPPQAIVPGTVLR
jgi:hypothetical protein